MERTENLVILSCEEYEDITNKVTILQTEVEQERHEKNNAINALRQMDAWLTAGDLK